MGDEDSCRGESGVVKGKCRTTVYDEEWSEGADAGW